MFDDNNYNATRSRNGEYNYNTLYAANMINFITDIIAIIIFLLFSLFFINHV